MLSLPALSGCDSINQMVDAEKARVEGRTVPLQLGAAMAFGVMQTNTYVQQFQGMTAADLQNINTCADVAVEGTELGDRSMAIDFGTCDEMSGRVLVTERPDESAPASGAEYQPGENLAYDVTFQNYEDGFISVDGNIRYLGNTTGGAFGMDIDVQVFTLASSLQLEGDWFTSDVGTYVVNVHEGGFTAATGLAWGIEANAVTIGGGCMEPQSGDIIATAGPVEIEALFDTTCDNCFDIFVDGQRGAPVCVPEGF